MSRADKTRRKTAAAKHKLEQERLAEADRAAAAQKENGLAVAREIEDVIYPDLLKRIDAAAGRGLNSELHHPKSELEEKIIQEKLANAGYKVELQQYEEHFTADDGVTWPAYTIMTINW